MISTACSDPGPSLKSLSAPFLSTQQAAWANPCQAIIRLRNRLGSLIAVCGRHLNDALPGCHLQRIWKMWGLAFQEPLLPNRLSPPEAPPERHTSQDLTLPHHIIMGFLSPNFTTEFFQKLIGPSWQVPRCGYFFGTFLKKWHFFCPLSTHKKWKPRKVRAETKSRI